jgi:hypothetical protein
MAPPASAWFGGSFVEVRYDRGVNRFIVRHCVNPLNPLQNPRRELSRLAMAERPLTSFADQRRHPTAAVPSLAASIEP